MTTLWTIFYCTAWAWLEHATLEKRNIVEPELKSLFQTYVDAADARMKRIEENGRRH
jgi:hypothetical protein